MSSLLHTLYQTRQIRQLEHIAVDQLNVPEIELMRRAGKAAFDEILKRFETPQRMLVFCGKGNNAGDGYIVARLAHEMGWHVAVRYLAEPGVLGEPAKTAAIEALEAGVECLPFTQGEVYDVDVVVDALLGIGLSGLIKSPMLKVLRVINAMEAFVFSIDTPSGLDVNKGHVASGAVKADVTITFLGLKQGMLTGDAPAYCGDVIMSHLGLGESVHKQVKGSAMQLDLSSLLKFLPAREQTAHKGDFGHVLVVGGDVGMGGAVRMAGEAAYRTGAGRVTCATRDEHRVLVSAHCPELMAYGVDGKKELAPLLSRATVVVLGPGLGQKRWGKKLFDTVLAEEMPKVVDADALKLLAQEPRKCDDWVLTPHPGEASALLGVDVVEIQKDRFAAAAAIQKKYGGACVLKGAGTVIVDGVHKVAVCAQGNPGMATAGMGDILTGIIAGLIAQGVALPIAARLGVCLHAHAGDEVARVKGQRGLMATDLLSRLPRLINATE